jgi:hypothetical protein
VPAALSLELAGGGLFFLADAGAAIVRVNPDTRRAKTVAREGPERRSERFMERSCR